MEGGCTYGYSKVVVSSRLVSSRLLEFSKKATALDIITDRIVLTDQPGLPGRVVVPSRLIYHITTKNFWLFGWLVS
jgi:hypothetical protein